MNSEQTKKELAEIKEMGFKTRTFDSFAFAISQELNNGDTILLNVVETEKLKDFIKYHKTIDYRKK